MVKMNNFKRIEKVDYNKEVKETVLNMAKFKNEKSPLFYASVTDNGVPADKVFKAIKEDLRGFRIEFEE